MTDNSQNIADINSTLHTETYSDNVHLQEQFNDTEQTAAAAASQGSEATDWLAGLSAAHPAY